MKMPRYGDWPQDRYEAKLRARTSAGQGSHRLGAARRSGYKASGFGRELGHWAVEEYLETKQVFINLHEKPIGWY